MIRRSVVFAIVALAARPESVAAQSPADRFEIGVQIASAYSSEFDATDIGAGGRFAWLAARFLGLEAELNLYPRDYPDRVAFSRARWEGLFGVTAGRRFGRVRPFAKVRPGFVTFREAPQPIACIAIFPPPLACVLASGRTLFAFDVGGGVQLFVSRKTFVRADAGDRLLRYPGPAFDGSRTARQDAFISHDFRFAAGAGLRF